MRYSLANLLVLAAVFAGCCWALTTHSLTSANVLSLTVAGSLCYALLRTIYFGRQQPFWLGFALFGIGRVVWWICDVFLWRLEPTTRDFVNYLARGGWKFQPEYYDVLAIAHVITLAFACVGGTLAYLIVREQRRRETSGM